MISGTTSSISLGKFRIAMLLAILTKQVSRRGWTTALWSGIAGGAGISLCYAIAYGLTNGMLPG